MSFRSYAKLIFSANEMPVNLDEKSDAFYRRMLTIEVSRKGEKIPNLKEELRNSMPGFICECMNALHRMYVSEQAIDSKNSRQLVHEYHRESDNVQAFLDDRTVIKSGVKIERGELYSLYRSYCVFNQWTPLNNRSFYKNLRGKGFRDYMSSGSRYFKGLCSIDDKSALDSAGFRQATLEESDVFTGK